MRALILSPALHGGGAERCARELFERLPARGVDARLWVGRPATAPGVTTIRTRVERLLAPLERLHGPADGRHLGSRVALRLAPRLGYDVVHLNNLHGGWVSVRAVQRLCRAMPSVWWLHDEWAVTEGLPYDLSRALDPPELERRFPDRPLLHPGSRLARRWRRFLAGAMPVPSVLVAPSRYLLALAADAPRLRDVPRRVVRYGVTLLEEPAVEQPRPVARARFGLAPEAPVVLLIAASFSSPYKGAWLAIEALARLRTPGATVLIAGKNADGLVRALSARCVAAGYLATPQDLAAAYRAADVTLLPSTGENMSYVALESMTCRTPVVAFEVEGPRELLGDGERGLLAPRFDSGALAAATDRLLADASLRARLGQAGRAWVEAEWSMERSLAGIIDAYAEAQARFAAARA